MSNKLSSGSPSLTRRHIAAADAPTVPPSSARPAPLALALGEIVLVTLWALWIGRAYLDFSPRVWPGGRELGLVIRTHYIWTLLPRCGTCVFWNGSFNGGSPAFAELQGAVLHPLVILTTLIWGGVNGTKAVLICSLAMAGYAQLWLGRVMGLHGISRLWTALIAVAGGHLAARMEHGVVGLVLSTAACSLVLAPALDFVTTGRRRAALLTAVMSALALLSGQAYLQLGLLCGVVPGFALSVWISGGGKRRAIKGLLLITIVAMMLAGPLVVPLLHSLPHFTKDQDLEMRGLQPLEYLPLNLVIRDPAYYRSWSLEHLPYPYLYGTYIGWLPVILALLAIAHLVRTRGASQRLLALTLATAMIYLFASGVSLKLIEHLTPGDLGTQVVSAVRYPSVAAGLAVPALLVLAGWGLDRVLRSGTCRHHLLLQIAVGMLLIWSMVPVQAFAHTWLTEQVADDNIYQMTEKLRTPTAEWVRLPFGAHFWSIPALEAGLKVTDAFSPWRWEGRSVPPFYWGYTTVTGPSPQPEKGSGEYAYVEDGGAQTPCSAVAQGGHIDVICDTPGRLWVLENAWPGWQAWIDGARVELADGAWLNVEVPSGVHHIAFRYRPLDVTLGLWCAVTGILVTVLLWRHPVAEIQGLAQIDRWLDAVLDRVQHGWYQLRRRGKALIGRPATMTTQEVMRLTLLTSGGAALALGVMTAGFLFPGCLPTGAQRVLTTVFVLSGGINVVVLFERRRHRQRMEHKPESGGNDDTGSTDRVVG